MLYTHAGLTAILPHDAILVQY